jgi:uncharacterized protein (TIGR03067 family)
MPKLSYALAFFALGLACCSALAGDADDAKKLQGTWEILELTAYGKKVDFNSIKGTKFIFVKDKLTIQPPNDKLEELVTRNFSFKLTAAKKPAEVDLTILDGKDKGLTSPGIYEIVGDTLRWCQSDATKAPERPKGFTSLDKSTIYLFTLKRAK